MMEAAPSAPLGRSKGIIAAAVARDHANLWPSREPCLGGSRLSVG
jgi:hypothetical protein